MSEARESRLGRAERVGKKQRVWWTEHMCTLKHAKYTLPQDRKLHGTVNK